MNIIVYDSTSPLSIIAGAINKLIDTENVLYDVKDKDDSKLIELIDSLYKDSPIKVYLTGNGEDLPVYEKAIFINTNKWPELYGVVESTWRYNFGNLVPYIFQNISNKFILNYIIDNTDSTKLDLPEWTLVSNPYKFNYTRYNQISQGIIEKPFNPKDTIIPELLNTPPIIEEQLILEEQVNPPLTPVDPEILKKFNPPTIVGSASDPFRIVIPKS